MEGAQGYLKFSKIYGGSKPYLQILNFAKISTWKCWSYFHNKNIEPLSSFLSKNQLKLTYYVKKKKS